MSTRQAHSQASLLSETGHLAAGKNWLGLRVELDDEWHSYWRNPGDSASAPIFDWDLPSGIELVKVHYPRPQRIPFGPLESFGYEKETLYLFEVEVDGATLKKDQVSVGLDAEWVVCKVECVPGIFGFDLELPVHKITDSDLNTAIDTAIDTDNGAGTGAEHEPSATAALFAFYKQSLPQTKVIEATLEKQGGQRYQLSLEDLPENKIIDIFPFHNEKVANTKPTPEGEGQFSFERSEISSAANTDDKFLLLTESQSFVATAKPPVVSFALMLMFAFLGGLILNLMPCVFPVLALKVYALTSQSQENTKGVVLNQSVYVLGVLVSFWALAATIVGLRWSGSNLGWGFHLQSPLFVGLMLILFVLMGLMFLDFLPFQLSRFMGLGQSLTEKKGVRGAFFTGVLAVVVASPCTAPFMGAAMGYALSQPPLTVFFIFTGLGLGLGFPFLLFAVFPKLAQFLPKPGAWMQTFKKLMSVPMFATALWLGWVLSLQLQAGSGASDHYEKYSAARVNQELGEGRSVFVNFTAAWCISCQVNEKIVFSKPAVQAFFKEHEVVQLKADWTKKDDKIGAVLKSYGRAGVPLYLFFPEGRKDPEILPEILTESVFLSRLKQSLDVSRKEPKE